MKTLRYRLPAICYFQSSYRLPAASYLLFSRKGVTIRLFLLSIWSLITIIGLLELAPPAQAHDSPFPFRYVAPDGVDTGDCDEPAAPCRTILYAINQAIPGDQVRVAAGAYFFDQANLALLLSEIIPVKGGYSPADAFTGQDPTNHPTYLIGLDPRYQEEIEARGFALMRDAKESALDQLRQNRTGSELTAHHESTGFTPCESGRAGPYPCQGVDLLARLPLDEFSLKPKIANDIWGFVDQDDGREYAVIGLSNGVAVVDVTDPRRPLEVGAAPGPLTTWRDIKIYQFYNEPEGRWNAYAYVTADLVDEGLQIIDLNDLPHSISVAASYSGFRRAHNLYISDLDYTTNALRRGSTAYAYIMGSDLGTDSSNLGGVHILDLSNPIAPTAVATPTQAGYIHDGVTFVITDSRTIDCYQGHNPCELFIDFNESTVDVWDVTAKATPYRISSTPYQGAAYVHSGWWSADKMFVFIQDELDERTFDHNTQVRVLDISDLTTPFVSRIWTGPTPAIDHNGFTKANHYYMSNYRRGLTILDVANPNQPNDIAFFDTFPANDSANFNGAWGVYPYLPSGVILVSDIERGLFLLREQGLAIRAEGPGAVKVAEPIPYTLTVANNGVFPATNVVITAAIPAGADYLSGGARAGDVISWSVANLGPGAVTQTVFTVSTPAKTSLINDDYGVRAIGSVTATGPVRVAGQRTVVTVVGGTVTYLPLILKPED